MLNLTYWETSSISSHGQIWEKLSASIPSSIHFALYIIKHFNLICFDILQRKSYVWFNPKKCGFNQPWPWNNIFLKFTFLNCLHNKTLNHKY